MAIDGDAGLGLQVVDTLLQNLEFAPARDWEEAEDCNEDEDILEIPLTSDSFSCADSYSLDELSPQSWLGGGGHSATGQVRTPVPQAARAKANNSDSPRLVEDVSVDVDDLPDHSIILGPDSPAAAAQFVHRVLDNASGGGVEQALGQLFGRPDSFQGSNPCSRVHSPTRAALQVGAVVSRVGTPVSRRPASVSRAATPASGLGRSLPFGHRAGTPSGHRAGTPSGHRASTPGGVGRGADTASQQGLDTYLHAWSGALALSEDFEDETVRSNVTSVLGVDGVWTPRSSATMSPTRVHMMSPSSPNPRVFDLLHEEEGGELGGPARPGFGDSLAATSSSWGWGDTGRSNASDTPSSDLMDLPMRVSEGSLAYVLQQMSSEGLTNFFDASVDRSLQRVLQAGSVLAGQRLTDEEIRALPRVRFESIEQQCCPICLEAFHRGEIGISLQRCSHFFHTDCLSSWLRQSTKCPLCRSSADC